MQSGSDKCDALRLRYCGAAGRSTWNFETRNKAFTVEMFDLGFKEYAVLQIKQRGSFSTKGVAYRRQPGVKLAP